MYAEMASVYDALMDNFDYPAWAAYYRALMARFGVAPRELCDAACGTGNMSLLFAASGVRVLGIDRSPDMLRLAAEKARAQGHRVQFVCQDMRQLTLAHAVPAITCACDGVNYLTTPDDARAFFQAAHAALLPGGGLFFDISTRHKLEGRMAGRFFGETRDWVAVLWQNDLAARTHLLTMTLTFFVKQPGGFYRRFEEQHVQRAHSAQEILAWLGEAGFAHAHVFGDQHFEPPGSTERRIHFAALK